MLGGVRIVTRRVASPFALAGGRDGVAGCALAGRTSVAVGAFSGGVLADDFGGACVGGVVADGFPEGEVVEGPRVARFVCGVVTRGRGLQVTVGWGVTSFMIRSAWLNSGTVIEFAETWASVHP